MQADFGFLNCPRPDPSSLCLMWLIHLFQNCCIPEEIRLFFIVSPILVREYSSGAGGVATDDKQRSTPLLPQGWPIAYTTPLFMGAIWRAGVIDAQWLLAMGWRCCVDTGDPEGQPAITPKYAGRNGPQWQCGQRWGEWKLAHREDIEYKMCTILVVVQCDFLSTHEFDFWSMILIYVLSDPADGEIKLLFRLAESSKQ